jgi:hypothetical protein
MLDMTSAPTWPQVPADQLQVAARVKFIEHQGQRVLFVNYAECDIPMLKAVAEEMHRVISKEPPNSVLTLNDVTGTGFDTESVAVLKSRVAANAPYVRRAAVIGITGLQRLIYEAIQRFSQRSIPRFNTKEQALDWLIKE